MNSKGQENEVAILVLDVKTVQILILAPIRFEVLTALTMGSTVFWDITPCSLVVH
jgi:hypothetical protein